MNGSPPKNGDAKDRDEIVIELDLEDRLEDIEQALLREKMAFELAKTKLELLEKYSRRKTTKSLQIDVERKQLRRTGQESDLGTGDSQRKRNSSGRSPPARW